MAVVDVNLDGAPDLVTVTSDYPAWRGLEILRGDGAGGLTIAGRIEAEAPVTSMAVGDFNADGVSDLAVAPWFGSPATPLAFAVFFGDGQGSFRLGPSVALGLSSVTAMAAGDFNRDGNADLVVSRYSASLSVFLGKGSGDFERVDVATRFQAAELVVADLDENGTLDLVLAGLRLHDPPPILQPRARDRRDEAPPFHHLGIWLGDESGGFEHHTDIQVPIGPRDIVVGDFNRDGVPDLGVACTGSSKNWNHTIGVLFGDGAGGFLDPVEHNVTRSPANLVDVDMDQDGFGDLAVAGFSIGFLRGGGANGFREWIEIESVPVRRLDTGEVVETPPVAPMIETSDFDRDGLPDLVSVGQDGNSIRVLSRREPPTVR